MHPLRILRFPSEYQKTMFRSALFALLASPVAALYSVHFMPGAGHSNVVRKPGVFATAPDAAQVADIYARLAGIAPVLHEGFPVYCSYLINGPTLFTSSRNQHARPGFFNDV